MKRLCWLDLSREAARIQAADRSKKVYKSHRDDQAEYIYLPAYETDQIEKRELEHNNCPEQHAERCDQQQFSKDLLVDLSSRCSLRSSESYLFYPLCHILPEDSGEAESNHDN